MLTPKQEAFCIAYIDNGIASTAYRTAYNAGKMLPATVHKRASELLTKREIAGRIEELKAQAAAEAQVTLVGHLNDMRRLRDNAASAGQYGPAIKAEECRAKACGIYREKVEVKVARELSPLERAARVASLLAMRDYEESAGT